ncbi:MAG TPA: phosphoribosylaminoimidazolesuccinocarboxamide synthase [Candidatus Limnocylindria bacterium]|nr:phosphoribosylaminoimidazolesuccinocarboxamide synthase [Candidatus Limnocylindria bacterium]
MSLANLFVRSGKVRDLYRLGDDRLLIVASDRLSAFDVVLPTPIPDKGKVLTGLSRFWFAETEGIVDNHLIATDPAELPAALRRAVVRPSDSSRDDDETAAETLRGRMMLCREVDILPIEIIVRGYLAGSGWKEYQATGELCGIRLPDGLQESERLPAPIFTPSTKADIGAHDENITFDSMVERLGADPAAADLAERIREVALRLYGYAAAVAERAGIILADTKFEFGTDARGRLVLADEVLTPDSSRFWEAAAYEPGHPQPSYDKQFVRDWLEGQDWDKTAPGPELPPEIVAGTRERYVAAYEKITGASFARYLAEDSIAQ